MTPPIDFPLPWRMDEGTHIVDRNGRTVAVGVEPVNMEFILWAVNRIASPEGRGV